MKNCVVPPFPFDLFPCSNKKVCVSTVNNCIQSLKCREPELYSTDIDHINITFTLATLMHFYVC